MNKNEKQAFKEKGLAAAIVMAGMLCAGCGALDKQESGFVTRQDSSVIISVLAGQSTSDAGIEDMINEVVAEKFPEIRLEWECVDWGDAFSSQLQARLASGDVPDLIVGKAQDVAPYAKSGALEDFSIEGSEKIEEGALENVTIDGKMYGLPYNAWYQGVLYNKKIFSQYHLAVPETRTELDKTVAVLEKNGVVPFAAHFQEAWSTGNMTMQFMIGDVFEKEDDWGEKFRADKRSFTKNPVMQNCFEQNMYIKDHAFADALMIDQYESDKRFADGEAAMYLTGAWSLQAINQYSEDREYGIFPYPNSTGDASLIRETNMTFMIGKDSHHKEYVCKILEELLQNQKLMQEILDFTQTYSVVEGIQTEYESCIKDDVKRYEQEDRIVDATIGNSQLIWNFQNEIAENTFKWLNQELTLKEVLSEADKNRNNS